jgi:TPR repeat protein
MLLETARTLIARDGEEALTLGAVADEAGLARATIYGYFSGKQDLLAALDSVHGESQAITEMIDAPAAAGATPRQANAQSTDQNPSAVIAVAQAIVPETGKTVEREPQTAFAFSAEPVLTQDQAHAEKAAEPANDAQQNIEPIEQKPSDVPVEAVSDAAPVETPTVDHAVETPVLADVSQPERVADHTEALESPVATSDSDETESLTPREQERRQQALHLEEIAKRLILPDSALKEGTDAVIARLETRLRVLERSISGLEARQNAIPDEMARKIKPISDLVTQLQTRADAMEDRQRQALAELRLSIHELTARQNALSPSPVAVPEMPAWPQAGFNPVKVEEALAEETVLEKSEEQIAAENARNAYLSTARNLAKEGARQAAERESLVEEDQRRRRRHLLTAAAVAGVCLIAVGALFMLRPGPHGVSVAQAKSISHVAVAKNQNGFVSGAPLDRLTALANRGDARAELVVGLKYLKGDGVPASDKDAARWFERSAKAGNAVAQNHLGALYQAGRGVPVDMTQAMHWYDAAAMQGDRHAMSNLAVLYAGGSGGPKNFAESARWFQRSAELGYIDAQFNLAVLFERGDGVPQSLLDAYKWYSIAAAAGDPVAKTRADAIATQVSSEELQAAQQVAANFKPRPINPAANDIPSIADVLAAR